MSSHPEIYNYYGEFENQNNFNINVTDFPLPELPYFNNNFVYGQHSNSPDDSYNLTSLNNQLVVSDRPTLTPNHNQLETPIPPSSYVSTSSLSSDYYHRPLSTTSLDSLDASRSIGGCKHDLIKATLSFAIKSRRRSLGLGDIEVNQAKNQDPRPSSWTDEDDEKKMSRRERNRIAARKCRKNRKLKFIGLNKTMENLDNANTNLKEQLKKLKRESDQLEDLLTSHQSQCYFISWSPQPTLNSTAASLSPSPQLSHQSQSLSSSISSLLSTSSSPSPSLLTNNHSSSDESHGFFSYINPYQSGILLG
ncbi:proto-oncogene c-Fos [Tetranychus urticae]|uniref:BZIP domain-containing protein n=1 Tax=Tetranychus urticae TaxID=32264 RepID=T1KD25_TETUR|nr:proto-oncogene c-Fos [Tetranychus urticae]